MGNDDACTSCSLWRHHLGGLKHARVISGQLVGWGHLLLVGVVSCSGAPICIIICTSLILPGEACALLSEQFGRGSSFR
jgi:hypothetical protein